MEFSIGTTFDWAWSIILGLVALPLISLVIQSKWAANTKRVTVLVVSAVLAGGYMLAKGLLSGVPPEWGAGLANAAIMVAGIVVVTQAVYNLLKGPLSAWEKVTDLNPQPEEVPDEPTEGEADTGEGEPEDGAEDAAEPPEDAPDEPTPEA